VTGAVRAIKPSLWPTDADSVPGTSKSCQRQVGFIFDPRDTCTATAMIHTQAPWQMLMWRSRAPHQAHFARAGHAEGITIPRTSKMKAIADDRGSKCRPAPRSCSDDQDSRARAVTLGRTLCDNAPASFQVQTASAAQQIIVYNRDARTRLVDLRASAHDRISDQLEHSVPWPAELIAENSAHRSAQGCHCHRSPIF
jgi:hypothetical protein